MTEELDIRKKWEIVDKTFSFYVGIDSMMDDSRDFDKFIRKQMEDRDYELFLFCMNRYDDIIDGEDEEPPKEMSEEEFLEKNSDMIQVLYETLNKNLIFSQIPLILSEMIADDIYKDEGFKSNLIIRGLIKEGKFYEDMEIEL